MAGGPARGAFARAMPAIVAGWALGGFYLSLGPTLAAQLTGSANLLWGGAVAFLLTGVGAATAFAARNLPAPAQMLGGCLALVAGAGVTIAAIGTGTALVYSAAVAGLAAVAAATFASRGSSRTGPSAQSAAAASDVCPVPCTVPPHVPSAHQEAELAKVPR